MIALDVETTGVDPRGHSVIEVSAVDLENPYKTFFSGCQAVKGRPVSDFALKVNGYTIEEIYDSSRPTPLELVNDLEKWLVGIDKRVIVGQNAKFDTDFMAELYDYVGKKTSFGRRSFDLHTLAAYKMIENGVGIPLKEDGTSNLNGDIITDYVGIPREPRPHKGSIDVNGSVWGAEIYHRLVNGKGFMERFKGFGVPDYLKK